MKKVVIGIIVVVILGVLGYFGYQQLTKPKTISRDEVKKEVASDESLLAEADYFAGLTAKGKTTSQYTSVHAQNLHDQLQSSQKTFSSSQVEKNVGSVVSRQQDILGKATDSLDQLVNTSTAKTAGSVEKTLHQLFLSDERIENSL